MRLNLTFPAGGAASMYLPDGTLINVDSATLPTPTPLPVPVPVPVPAPVPTPVPVPIPVPVPVPVPPVGSGGNVGGQIIQVDYPVLGQTKVRTTGLCNDPVAFKITVPTNLAPHDITHLGFMRIVEVPGQTAVFRDVTVSRTALDFDPAHALVSGHGDPSPQFNWTLNNASPASVGASFNLIPGDVVYFNLRNNSCDQPTCDVSFDFATPNRY